MVVEPYSEWMGDGFLSTLSLRKDGLQIRDRIDFGEERQFGLRKRKYKIKKKKLQKKRGI